MYISAVLCKKVLNFPIYSVRMQVVMTFRTRKKLHKIRRGFLEIGLTVNTSFRFPAIKFGFLFLCPSLVKILFIYIKNGHRITAINKRKKLILLTSLFLNIDGIGILNIFSIHHREI